VLLKSTQGELVARARVVYCNPVGRQGGRPFPSLFLAELLKRDVNQERTVEFGSFAPTLPDHGQ
jgi:hypothetical protein